MGLPRPNVTRILNDSLAEGAIVLRAEAASWQETFKLAGNALAISNRVTPKYTEAMIEAYLELGPYMVIAPGIALAHARPSAEVMSTGLSLITLQTPVSFGSERFDPVSIVFGLAAIDHESHIDLMAALSELLMNEENVKSLLAATDVSQVRELLG